MKRSEDTRLIRKAALLWLAMLALMACSVAAALMLDGWLATLLPLGVSVLLAGIVAVAFMEIGRADAVSLIGAGVSVAFLGVLFTLTFADELTRSHIPPGFGADPETDAEVARP